MRLLIVEDDQDGREMLAELFRIHAWEVTAVPTTEAGMTELRKGGFDVVISDEDLVGSSGSAMLREASAQGLLRNVGALMYTAEPARLDLPEGERVLQKPIGITRLLDEVQAVVAEPAEVRVPSSGARTRKTTIELVLYVTDSPSSQRALRNLHAVLAEMNPKRVEIVVHNVDRDPLDEGAAASRISSTPVLVKRHPGEQLRYVGDLDSTRSLEALIHDLEEQAPASSERSLHHAFAPLCESPPSSRAR
jgi:DNA-binding response OmpR family regulator